MKMSNGYKIYTSEEYVKSNYSSIPKLLTLSLPASEWIGAVSPYYQTVNIEGVTNNSKIDLQLTETQVAELQSSEISFATENDGGIVLIYAIGGKPDVDYKIQAMATETGTTTTGNDNINSGHTHGNKAVLDKFGEVDGAVVYNGEVIKAENVDLDGYSTTEEIEEKLTILKEEIVDGAPEGFETLGNISNLYNGEIKTLKESSHLHENSEVINKFSEVDGQLAYNNTPIGGKLKIKSITVANDWTEGQVYGQQGASPNDGVVSFLVMEDTWNTIAPAMVVGVDVTYLNATLPISCFLSQYSSAKTPIFLNIPTLDIGLGGYEVLRLANCVSGDNLFQAAFNDDGKISKFTVYYLEIDYDTNADV